MAICEIEVRYTVDRTLRFTIDQAEVGDPRGWDWRSILDHEGSVEIMDVRHDVKD